MNLRHVWLGATLVIVTVIVSLLASGWWLFGPGQIATREDIAQLRAEVLSGMEELRAATRARQRAVDEVGRLVRDADGRPRR